MDESGCGKVTRYPDVLKPQTLWALQKEIDYFKSKGIEFRALSPTKLEI